MSEIHGGSVEDSFISPGLWFRRNREIESQLPEN